MKPRLLYLESPACECDDGVCPYLEDGKCWGSESAAEYGASEPCVDNGYEIPRYTRHIGCPFGRGTVEVRMRIVKARKEEER